VAGRAGPTAGAEKIQTFDPHTVHLGWVGRHWQVLAGDTLLKDFGPRESDARQAVRVIQELHLNQHGTVGGPNPVMEYWLADGHAPSSPAGGLRALPLVPQGLRVEQKDGQWCLRDSQRVLFNFGTNADDARQALTVMRKYGFSQVGLVGQGAPSMYLFLARPDSANTPQPLPGAHSTASSSRRLNVPHFSRQARPPEMPTQQAGAIAPADLAKLASAFPTLLTQPTPGVRPDRPAAPLWREKLTFSGRSHLPAGMVPTAERIPFDWRQAQVRLDNADWRLTAGTQELANFGSDEQAARRALTALRHYRFTEEWRVGAPTPSFTYFLANGQAPRGVMLGVNAVTFRPEALKVRQVEGKYALYSGEQVLARFGARPDEAERLLEVIKRNQFDRLCNLGDGTHGMTFLVRSH
jgi:hypothetical protein